MADLRPLTRSVPQERRAAVAALFTGRGHALQRHAKNPYLAFEVRTAGRSIFTLYTSGKLVATVRGDDAEGRLLDDDLSTLLGDGGRGAVSRPALAAPRTTQIALAGLDETGTGEILGSALVAGALLPRALADEVSAVAGAVETKVGRAASGWERLAEELAGLRRRGLVLTLLPIPNRLFDAWSKNGLLDLAYLRAVANLRAAAGGANDLHLAIDDYGAGDLLADAAGRWRAQGLDVVIEPRADDLHLAARTASVWARAGRARELLGLESEVSDGPLGSGNPGHRDTRAWLRRRARSGRPWPSFVKTSFSTVRELMGADSGAAFVKARVPALDRILGDEAATALRDGTLSTADLELPAPRGALRALRADVHRVLDDAPAVPFLPLLLGGLVLDALSDDLARLDALLERESGLASGWRVLSPPELDPAEPFARTLLAAHRKGIIALEPCAQADPAARAVAHGALPVDRRAHAGIFSLVLD